jgi:hypothetical protein
MVRDIFLTSPVPVMEDATGKEDKIQFQLTTKNVKILHKDINIYNIKTIPLTW